MGFTFQPVTGTEFKLGDLTAKNMDPDSDALQVLDTETTAALKCYTYFSPELAKEWEETPGEYDDCIGWWEKGMYGEAEYYYGNEPIQRGQAFLLLNGLYHEIIIQGQGEVPMKATSVTFSENHPMIANYLPVDMKLKDLKVEGAGMDPDSDALQLLDTETTAAIKCYTYFSAELAKEWEETPGEYDDCIGWWEKGMYGEAEYYYGDEIVKAGQGFLALNGLYHEITVDFPSALDVSKIEE